MTYQKLLGFEDSYEIDTIYPYEIRNIKTNRILKESSGKNKYITVHLDQQTYNKHILIAKQFIPNPTNLPCVDHKNHKRDDNRIENLRWVSFSDNSKNKSSHRGVQYKFIDYEELNEEDLILVGDYNDHEIEDYYYCENTNKFYYDTGVGYRELYINHTKSSTAFVRVNDVNNKAVNIEYNKFKKSHDIFNLNFN